VFSIKIWNIIFMHSDYIYNGTHVFFFLTKIYKDIIFFYNKCLKNPYYIPLYVFTFYFCIHFTPDYIEILTNRFMGSQSVVTWQKNVWWITKRYINKIFISWSLTVWFSNLCQTYNGLFMLTRYTIHAH